MYDFVTGSGLKVLSTYVQKDMLINWLVARDFSVTPRMTTWHNSARRDKKL